MAKQAFIVLGPESSGTRFLTRLFIRAGAFGDGDHAQRLDAQLSAGEKPAAPVVVIRRSYPYAKEWPNLGKLKTRLEYAGYQVRAVLIIRSLQFTARSSNRQQHTKGFEKAVTRSTNALAHIGAALLATDMPYVWVTYESLTHRPELELQWLFDWAGLPVPGGIEVYDGNAKYV